MLTGFHYKYKIHIEREKEKKKKKTGKKTATDCVLNLLLCGHKKF